MSRPTEIIAEKKFPSQIEKLSEIQDFVSDKLSDFLSKQKLDSIILAVSEAVTNAIKHGNNFDSKKNVVLKIILDGNSVRIIIKDSGKGFNPKIIPNPTRGENLLKESGRGIFIIKNMVDNLRFNFTENGTETILEIRR